MLHRSAFRIATRYSYPMGLLDHFANLWIQNIEHFSAFTFHVAFKWCRSAVTLRADSQRIVSSLVLIHSEYSRYSRIGGLSISNTQSNVSEVGRALQVEQCQCGAGYSGSSCEVRSLNFLDLMFDTLFCRSNAMYLWRNLMRHPSTSFMLAFWTRGFANISPSLSSVYSRQVFVMKFTVFLLNSSTIFMSIDVFSRLQSPQMHSSLQIRFHLHPNHT